MERGASGEAFKATVITIEVSVYLRVHDPKRFVAAAQYRAVEEGVDPDDAVDTYNEDDLGACARMLFDPGVSPPGCEILDSTAEEAEL